MNNTLRLPIQTTTAIAAGIRHGEVAPTVSRCSCGQPLKLALRSGRLVRVCSGDTSNSYRGCGAADVELAQSELEALGVGA